MAQANQAAQDQSASKLISKSVADEAWREYEWTDPVSGKRVVYRIDKPAKAFFYNGCTTHRILDAAGVVHCVPSIGFHGCVLRWGPSDPNNPVQW